MIPRRALAIGVLLLLAAGPVHAIDNPYPEEPVISPGVKIGWTFGPGGGLTWGAEVSVLWRTGEDLSAILAHGPVVNLTWSPRAFHARAGWEAVSWFVGIEAGPALVRDASGTHLGLGVTPWVGFAYVVPYYTLTLAPGMSTQREGGVYLKLPVCVGCSGGDGDDFDWDD